MAQLRKGILGPFSGTVGTVIGGSWRGIDYIRSLPKKSKSSTEKQVIQRAKFALVAGFLATMSDLVQFTFRDFKKDMTARNNAMSEILSKAVTGVYPNLQLSYSQVLVSSGKLPNGISPGAGSAAGGSVRFEWGNNAGMGKAKATDKAILVVYAPDLNHVGFILGGPPRSAEQAELVDLTFSGHHVHTWLAFISDDGKSIGNSIYTGEITVV